MATLFNIQLIEQSLKGFQAAFPQINNRLLMRRELVDDTIVANIVVAYKFLNSLIEQKIDLFTPAGLHALLELNHLVLCGPDLKTRGEYYQHLMETRKGFLKKIKPIKEWVLSKIKENDPFKLATGFYTKALSQPQLFLEGNHRTGNIILNYLLASKGAPPYIASADNAQEYLDISGDIKFTFKEKALDSALKMPGQRKRFRQFLQNNTDGKFLQLQGQPS